MYESIGFGYLDWSLTPTCVFPYRLKDAKQFMQTRIIIRIPWDRLFFTISPDTGLTIGHPSILFFFYPALPGNPFPRVKKKNEQKLLVRNPTSPLLSGPINQGNHVPEAWAVRVHCSCGEGDWQKLGNFLCIHHHNSSPTRRNNKDAFLKKTFPFF